MSQPRLKVFSSSVRQQQLSEQQLQASPSNGKKM